MERGTRVSTWCDRERHLDLHPWRHQVTERKRQVMTRVPERISTIKSPNDSPRPQGLGADPGRSHHHGARAHRKRSGGQTSSLRLAVHLDQPTRSPCRWGPSQALRPPPEQQQPGARPLGCGAPGPLPGTTSRSWSLPGPWLGPIRDQETPSTPPRRPVPVCKVSTASNPT